MQSDTNLDLELLYKATTLPSLRDHNYSGDFAYYMAIHENMSNMSLSNQIQGLPSWVLNCHRKNKTPSKLHGKFSNKSINYICSCYGEEKL